LRTLAPIGWTTAHCWVRAFATGRFREAKIQWLLSGSELEEINIRSRHTADIHPGILWGRFTFHFGHSQTENESQHFRFEGTRSKGWISATSVHETLRLAPLAGAVQYRTFY